MSAHHILGLGEGPKGSAVRRLKWYASWVQNVVRQFGPYLLWAKEICGELSSVREDRDGRTAGASVGYQIHGRVAKSGRDKR